MDALLLFDIDGTLVQRASVAHAQALRQAIEQVHAVGPQVIDGAATGLEVAGRTDGEIARILLLGSGVSAERIDAHRAAVREECCRRYAESCPPDLSAKVAPGIRDLLAWLGDRGGVRLGLVTGNFEPVARLKLRRAGLGQWFDGAPGAFGSDSEDRAALPAIARRRAGANGVSWQRSRTLVIGDTPRDIACARADGVSTIAVTTGPHGAAALAGADAVAQSPQELRAALADWLDGGGVERIDATAGLR